jgi:zinc-ribbon domain
MFCDRCGTRIDENQRFCPSCGKTVGAVPLMPSQGRIAGHVRLLGILWLAFAAIYLIPGFFLMVVFSRGGLEMTGAPPFAAVFMRMIGMFFIGGAVLGLMAGWGLLERQPWARMLAIVLGCISLIHIPFGTVLGVYTLWVLLPAASEEEYRQLARVA